MCEFSNLHQVGSGAGQSGPVVRFYFHLRLDEQLEQDPHGLVCADVHEAYLAASRAIPDLAAYFLARGRDPNPLVVEIALADGPTLMEVPFEEVLRPHLNRNTGLIRPRSRRAMISAAQKYRSAFEGAPFGAVILTPDLEYVCVNDMVTELTSETNETTTGFWMEGDEIRSRDPGDTVPRAAASLAIVRDSRRRVQDESMFWGKTLKTALRPPISMSYWPIVDEDTVVALVVRMNASLPGH